MDRVVQQNAANAEESASAAEEMNAQAEQMKGYVGELTALIGGNENGVVRDREGAASGIWRGRPPRPLSLQEA